MGSGLSAAPVDVAKAVAGLAVGDVGTYAFLLKENAGYILAHGGTFAGSGLKYANANTGGNFGYSNVSPAGTWRVMGQIGYVSGTHTYNSKSQATSVWLRIS